MLDDCAALGKLLGLDTPPDDPRGFGYLPRECCGTCHDDAEFLTVEFGGRDYAACCHLVGLVRDRQEQP